MSRALLICLLAAACGGADSSTCQAPLGFETETGACAGVSEGELCSGRFCVPVDAACTTMVYVQEGASGGGSEGDPFGALAEAATVAKAGDCIAIAAGSYQGASLAGGVSLLGAGAARVTIEGGEAAATLVLGGGSGALVRGVHLGGATPGISASGASGLVFEQVAVEAAAEAGIALFDSTAELRSVVVRGTIGEPGYGIYVQGGEITVRSSLSETNGGAGIVAIGSLLVARDTVVRDNMSYGVAVQSSSEWSTLERAIVTGNGRVGVFVSGAPVRLDACEVASTRLVDGGARCIEVQAGGEVEIAGGSIHDSEKIGVLVDASRLLMEGGECNANEERGFWFQGIGLDQVIDGRSVMLDGVTVQDNGFVGVGGTESAGLVIQAGVVGRTRLIPIIDVDSIVRAGDGLQALNGTDLLARGVLLEGNERAAALFDASTGGTTDCIVDPRGGEKGLVIQAGVPADGFTGNTDPNGAPVTPEIPPEPLQSSATLLAAGGLLEAL